MMPASVNLQDKKIPPVYMGQTILAVILFLYAFMEFMPVYEAVNSIMLGFVVVFTIFMHFLTRKNLCIDKNTAEAYVFLIVWLIYCILTIFWAHDPKQVQVYATIIIHYLLVFVIFTQFFLSPKRQQQLIIFYQLILICYLGLAIWELTTGKHLPVSVWYGRMVPMPSGPFYQENMLAAFWLILLPYFSVPTFLNKSKPLSILVMIMTVVIFLMTLLQGARIAIIAIAVGGLFYVIRWATWTIRISFIILIMAVPFYFAKYQPTLWRATKIYATEQIGSLHTEAKSATISSFKIRVQLFKEGVDMMVQSGALGVGGGNFEDAMRGGRLEKAGGMTNPHNFLVELLGNFGLIIFLGFLYLYVYWLYTLVYLIRNGDKGLRRFYLAHLLSLLMFIPTSALPSSIRSYYLIWIYFAGIHSSCVIGMTKLKSDSNSERQLTTDEKIFLA